MKIIYEKRSAQKLIRVVEMEGRLLLLLEGRGEIHSEYDPRSVLLRPVEEHYWNILTLFGLCDPSIKNVLIIGLGAGTCARQLLAYRADLSIEGVEIDPEITDVGQRFFGFDPHRVHIKHEDATSFLINTAHQYDYVIVDAFVKGNLARQFLSAEFYALVKSRLTKNGLVAINYLHERDWQAILKRSLHTHFSSVGQVGIPGCYNFVALATDKKRDLAKIFEFDPDITTLKNFVIAHIQPL